MRLTEVKVEITNKCLLNCVHCSTGCNASTVSVLPQPLIEKVVKEAVALGCQNFLLSGGDPLLHPGLGSLLNFLSSRNVQVKIYTTGIVDDNPTSCVSKERLEELKAAADFGFAFSLYSSDRTQHDAVTGVKGSFEATVQAMRNATATDIGTEVHFVALRDTIPGFPSLVDFLDDLGISQISVLRFVPQGRGKDNAEAIRPGPEDFQRLRKLIVREKKRRPRIKIRVGSPFNILLIGNPQPCTTATDRMIVDADGFAYPCDALKRVSIGHKMSDVSRDSLSEILERGPLFRAVRMESIPDSCRQCQQVNQCRAGCLAQRLLSGGSLETCVDPGCLHALAASTWQRSAGKNGRESRCQVG